MRYLFLLLAILANLSSARGFAQSPSQYTPRPLPFSGGGYITFGGEGGFAAQPTAQAAGALGVYVESLHYRFHPGLDVRGEAGNGVVGTLSGPRVSYWLADGTVSFYAEALFGPQHFTSSVLLANHQYVTTDVEGITSKGVIGVDVFPWQHPHWGARLEYSQGTFTGSPNSRPRTVLVGVVLRFP